MSEDGDLIAGRYRLVRALGRGGMGIVYQAQQIQGTHFQRDVALKLIAPEYAAHPSYRDRFLHETRAMARVRSAHVLDVYDSGTLHDGSLYVAMQLVADGLDLAKHVHREGALEWRAAGRLILQAAQGLHVAHERKMVHRDVKPSNMLLERMPFGVHLYVSDFGLVKLADATTLTSPGGRAGATPAYAPPEQLRGEPVGVTADVYALARSYAHLLSGDAPRAHQSLDLDTLPVPRTVRDLLTRATQPEAEDRHQTMLAFAHDLRRALRTSRSASTRPRRRTRRSQPARRRRLPLRLALGACAVTLPAGIATGNVSDRPPTTQTATAGPLVLPHGELWHPAPSPSLRGLRLSPAVALANDDAPGGRLVIGLLRNPTSGPDPAPQALRRSARELTGPRAVRLGDAQALAYRGRVDNRTSFTLFLLPTSAGYAAVVCRAPGSDRTRFVRACESTAARLALSRARFEQVAPDAEYARALSAAVHLGPVERRRVAGTLSARPLSKRVKAATTVAAAYRKAAIKLDDVPAPLRIAPTHRRVVRACRSLARAFEDVASASRQNRAAAYRRAASAVTTTDAALRRQFDAMRRAGYVPTSA